MHESGSQAAISTALGGPFDLNDAPAYGRWRGHKLKGYPASAAEVTVEIDGLANPGGAGISKILAALGRANMAIYQCRDGNVSPALLRAFGERFGLSRLDHHLCAEEDGVAALTAAGNGGRRTYIPYTNHALSWHTDGYYNAPAQRVRAVILHCVRDAAGDGEGGGGNALLDPEIAYIRLRDENPDFIAALTHPECLTIPANRDGAAEIRPLRAGPVFTVDPASGALHMRFTARKRHVVWRDDTATRAAVSFLNALLADAGGPAFRHCPRPGQGLLSNNVLHDRTAFEDDPAEPRLMLRARYFDRVGGDGGRG